MSNCTENCIHFRVCGLKEKYEQYIKEFNELNEKWDLFQKNPSCPEFTDKNLLRVNQKQDNWFNNSPLDNVTKVTYNDKNEEENKVVSHLRQSIKNAEKLYYKNRNKDIPITVIGSKEFIDFANILETIINYKYSNEHNSSDLKNIRNRLKNQ